jgi:chromosome partitioning protein
LGFFARWRKRRAAPPPRPMQWHELNPELTPPVRPWVPPEALPVQTYGPAPKSHIIVFANEKGGVGKSTSAFHTCIALCNVGENVAALDIDLRQLTLDRALSARMESAREYGVTLPGPTQILLALSTEAELEEKLRMAKIHHGFIVIDVGGHDSPIARRAIHLADTIVTPVNDSFIDLDMLGRIDPRTGELKTLGAFARLVEHLKEPGLRLRERELDWVVMQNRSRNFATKNEKKVLEALAKIAPVAGYRMVPGLRERVVYRELFPQGLTLFDLEKIPGLGKPQPNAKAEIFKMLEALDLPSEALKKHLAPSLVSAPEEPTSDDGKPPEIGS